MADEKKSALPTFLQTRISPSPKMMPKAGKVGGAPMSPLTDANGKSLQKNAARDDDDGED